MSLQKYLEAQERTRKELDTLTIDITQSYNTAIEKLRGEDGLIDIKRLDQDTSEFKKTLIGELEKRALGHLKAEAGSLDELRKAQAAKAYLGFAPYEIGRIIDAVKSGFTFNTYYAILTLGNREQKIQPMIQPAINLMQEYERSKIKKEDAEEVLKHTNTKEKIDLERLEENQDITEELIWLIRSFQQKGEVTDEELKKNPTLKSITKNL